jgi:hypothetical protein
MINGIRFRDVRVGLGLIIDKNEITQFSHAVKVMDDLNLHKNFK